MIDLFPQIATESSSEDKKDWFITIFKSEVYDEIQSVTYKYGEAALEKAAEKTVDALTSDMDEAVDDLIIRRAVEYYDARLRTRLRFAMQQESDTQADDMLQQDDVFAYNLSVDSSINDSIIQAVTVKIHNFLIWGGLYRWYLKHGFTAQAAAYKSELDEMEDDIVNTFKAPNKAKRPLQPFGPARKLLF